MSTLTVNGYIMEHAIQRIKSPLNYLNCTSLRQLLCKPQSQREFPVLPSINDTAGRRPLFRLPRVSRNHGVLPSALSSLPTATKSVMARKRLVEFTKMSILHDEVELMFACSSGSGGQMHAEPCVRGIFTESACHFDAALPSGTEHVSGDRSPTDLLNPIKQVVAEAVTSVVFTEESSHRRSSNIFDIDASFMHLLHLKHLIQMRLGLTDFPSTCLDAPEWESYATISLNWSRQMGKPPLLLVSRRYLFSSPLPWPLRTMGQYTCFAQGGPTSATFDEIADIYVETIENKCPREPYYASGYSFGGAPAFKIGHRSAPFSILFNTVTTMTCTQALKIGTFCTDILVHNVLKAARSRADQEAYWAARRKDRTRKRPAVADSVLAVFCDQTSASGNTLFLRLRLVSDPQIPSQGRGQNRHRLWVAVVTFCARGDELKVALFRVDNLAVMLLLLHLEEKSVIAH
ncbi:hypothetical protein JB92DRAFT_3102257 [Gautieria morchelliformis]|nr:hypothetical protein JB92DRAFT_3102257 [Gautieria morchelliformis]